MDRRTVYAGANPKETDVLWAERFAMVGAGYLAQDLMGTANQVFGAACTAQTPPTLGVAIGPGRIYSVQPLEASTWSSLPQDLINQVLKQGIQLGSINIATPNICAAGQSVCYLIEGQYQDQDIDPAVSSYFNVSNPGQPFNGPNGSGATQPQTRHGAFAIQAKAGIPATTGTQTIPVADVGWTPMYVVTVAFGAITILAANIAPHASFPQGTGSFIVTYVGGATAPTGTAIFYKSGGFVSLTLPNLVAVSNSAQFSYAGIPGFLLPPGTGGIQQTLPLTGFSGGSPVQVVAQFTGPNSLNFIIPGSGWNVGGSKNINTATLVYALF